ncbi:amidohydrolase family protein [Agrococcus sp. HG114]|uniref:amidohydrolase family protein n=1 Tax=Agrococcus sp. HG114 TaxID=2969757 RepID=UPI00215B2953|nr:amidohydrolase family protein [Agrococcus sp. HG114]MCR8669885.1 amidohydrolase family protein [Agrococcus sp. HG114]
MPELRRVSGVRDVRPWGGARSDIHFDGDRIAAVEPHDPGRMREGMLEGRGLLALPTVVNAHAHVDKSWLGLPWQSYGGEPGVDGRIRHERARRGELGIPSVERSAAVLAAHVRHGTTALRTHVDVDLGVGLRGIEAVREAVAAYDGAIEATIVAFPQDGVLRRPGVLELLEEAARAGVDHSGGLDPASIDRDPVGQLDGIFGIAERHGAGIDIHLHDAAELGAFELELIVERVDRLGLAGRVTIAHGFALAQLPEARRRDLLQAMGELGMSCTTVAPLRLPQLPLAELDAAGVRLAFGTDGIRDLWSPYGDGDTLAIARQFARASSLVRDEELRRVVEVATSGAAAFVGRETHDLVPGARADVVLLDAEHAMDALVTAPPRRAVVGGGRLLHEVPTGA